MVLTVYKNKLWEPQKYMLLAQRAKHFSHQIWFMDMFKHSLTHISVSAQTGIKNLKFQ